MNIQFSFIKMHKQKNINRKSTEKNDVIKTQVAKRTLKRKIMKTQKQHQKSSQNLIKVKKGIIKKKKN